VRIGDELHFSPKYRFSELNWDDRTGVIEAFRDRVEGFYLCPAQKLNRDKDGFAAGLLCVAAIDFLARISLDANGVKDRIVKWLRTNIIRFEYSDLADRFYEEFRNGLVHEGRIKNAGQFSYEYHKVISMVDDTMLVNPDLLLNAVMDSFQSYLKKLRTDDLIYHALRSALLSDFQREVELAGHSPDL